MVKMTNADKFLKDGVSVEEFLNEMVKNSRGFKNEEIDVKEFCYCIDTEDMKTFLNKERKPTLTEDERVILRNMDKGYEKIGRYGGTIMVFYIDDIHVELDMFNHLFQFIQERRRI